MTFDAYYIWLGIPPEEQPPDFYRLLGLKRFENRADVVGMAAERQTSHVRKFASGEHQQRAAELLNEIAKARVVLLNPEQRLAYDAQLPAGTAQLSAAPADLASPNVQLPLPPSSNQPLPAQPLPGSLTPLPNQRSSRRQTSLPSAPRMRGRRGARNRKRSPIVELLKIVVGGGIGLLVGWWLLQTFLLSPDDDSNSAGVQQASRTPQDGKAAPSPDPEEPGPASASDPASPLDPNASSDQLSGSAAEPTSEPSESGWSQLRSEPSNPSSEAASQEILHTEAPFQQLKSQALLPDSGDSAPISLGRLGADAKKVTWTLSEELRSEPMGLELIAAEQLGRVWHVTLADHRSRPIAAIRQSVSGELNLVYSPFAATDPAECLDRASLALDLDGQRHTIQLTKRSGLSKPLALDLLTESTSIAINAPGPEDAPWRLVLLAAEPPKGVATSTSPSQVVSVGETLTIAWDQDAETQLKLQPASNGVELTLRSFYFIDPDARRREPFSLESFNAEYSIKSRNLLRDKQALAGARTGLQQISQQFARVQKQAANATPTQIAAIQAQIVALEGNRRKAEASARRLGGSIPKQEQIIARLNEINQLGVKLNKEARLHVAVELEKDGQRLRVWQAGGESE